MAKPNKGDAEMKRPLDIASGQTDTKKPEPKRSRTAYAKDPNFGQLNVWISSDNLKKLRLLKVAEETEISVLVDEAVKDLLVKYKQIKD